MSKKRSKRTNIRWGHAAHTFLNVIFVLAVAFLVGIGLTPIALLLVLLSKWRIFAVQPHHWLVNMRSNSPDLIVGLSFVIFLSQVGDNITSTPPQLGDYLATALWIILYIGWLLYLKPKTSSVAVAAQAMVSQFMGLTALFWISTSLPEVFVVLGAWFIASVSAQHFLNGYDEPLAKPMSIIWGLFVAQMAWLLNRWSVFFKITDNLIIPQIALVTGVLGYTLATLYHLEQTGKLNKRLTRRYVILAVVALMVIMRFTEWSNVR